MNKNIIFVFLFVVIIASGYALMRQEGKELPSGEVPEATTPSVSIKVGQNINTAHGFSLKLIKITEDSRCPANANCIWAGRVAAEFEISSATESKTIVMTTDTTVAFGGYDFKIDEVMPNKFLDIVTSPSEYVLTVSYISND